MRRGANTGFIACATACLQAVQVAVVLVGGLAGCSSSTRVDEPDVVHTSLAPAPVDPVGWPNWRGLGMTGVEIWKDRLRGSFTASLVAAGGRIYAVDEEGTVSVFRAGDRFESLARIAFDQRVLATPAIAGGEMFLRTESRLYCIPADSRKEQR